MQSYLFIGGNWGGLNVPVEDDRDFIQLPKGAADKSTYFRETLSIGGASVTVYRHASWTPEEVLKRLAESYKAWAMKRPGGRR